MLARALHAAGPIPLLAPLLAVALPLQAADFGGTATLTSDYVFRGISQSDRRVAPQAGLRLDTASGVYASAWASRVVFPGAPDARAEIDAVLGVQRALGADWAGDINATWFTYAGAPELDYVEWIATATWRQRRWVTLGVSGDVFATGHTGLYLQAGGRLPLTAATRLEFAGGYYRLEHAYGDDYAHAQAALVWAPRARAELRLTGHLTDSRARDLFGDLADPRLEASLQASF